jgi:hypothetical protein
MSPKPTELLDPRAFRMIPDGTKKQTWEERKREAKKRRDELIEKIGHPRDKKDAG